MYIKEGFKRLKKHIVLGVTFGEGYVAWHSLDNGPQKSMYNSLQELYCQQTI